MWRMRALTEDSAGHLSLKDRVHARTSNLRVQPGAGSREYPRLTPQGLVAGKSLIGPYVIRHSYHVS